MTMANMLRTITLYSHTRTETYYTMCNIICEYDLIIQYYKYNDKMHLFEDQKNFKLTMLTAY